MDGAGSAYARPSRRRKFLPPRSRVARELERGDEQRGEDALARERLPGGRPLELASSSASRSWFIGSSRRVSTAWNSSSLLPK